MAKICPYTFSTLLTTPLTEDEEKEKLIMTALRAVLEEEFPGEKDGLSHVIAGIELLIKCREEKCGKYNSCHNIKGE